MPFRIRAGSKKCLFFFEGFYVHRDVVDGSFPQRLFASEQHWDTNQYRTLATKKFTPLSKTQMKDFAGSRNKSKVFPATKGKGTFFLSSIVPIIFEDAHEISRCVSLKQIITKYFPLSLVLLFFNFTNVQENNHSGREKFCTLNRFWCKSLFIVLTLSFSILLSQDLLKVAESIFHVNSAFKHLSSFREVSWLH